MIKSSIYVLLLNLIILNAVCYSEELAKNFNLVGRGEFNYYFWNVYQIELYAPNKKIESEFILKLNYKINLTGEDIARASIAEISKQSCGNKNEYTDWLNIMKKIFPDVDKGDSLAGYWNRNGRSTFYKNNQFIGEFSNAVLSKCFFDIWLGSKTSKKELRKKLLNKNL